MGQESRAMKILTKTVLLVVGLTLAACEQTGRFDNPSNNEASDYFNQDNLVLAASDPQSPAYFQQFVGDRVLYNVNEYTLSVEARGILDGQAEWLIANPGFTAIVEGHADERGTREYNLALGD